ncbi:hypothetical protein P4S72_26670 [Vibrio sp. PP-XX7]
MMKSKVAAIVLGVVFILGAVGFFLLKGKNDDYRITYQPGSSYTYAVSYHSDATGVTSFAGQGTTYRPDMKVNYVFDGEIILHTIDADLNQSQFEITFQPKTFLAQINAEVNHDWPADLVVAAVLDHDGKFQQLTFQESYFDVYAPVVKDILSQFQLPASNAGNTNWQGVEEDFSSVYDTYYKMMTSFWPRFSVAVEKVYRPRNAQMRLKQQASISIGVFSHSIRHIAMNRARTIMSGSSTAFSG